MVKSGTSISEEAGHILFAGPMQNHQLLWETKKANILAQLSAEEVRQLTQHSIFSVKERGTLIYPGESDVPRFYIIDRGYVRFCRISTNGNRLISGFLGPADVFGSLFSTDTTPTAPQEDFLEVVREARLIGIDATVFKSVLQAHPAFLMRMLEILETRKNKLEHRINSLLTKDVYAQTAEILIELGDKFGEHCADEPDHFRNIALTHQEIADLVGVARPTVSKIISEFLKSDLLHKHQSHLCLHNLSGLNRVAELGQKALA